MTKALILSAGQGIRLKPLTDKCPKSMLKIDGKPLLEHIINLLKHYGIREIGINLYYLPGVITNYFGNGKDFGVKIKYSRERKLLGSAGALNNFKHFFKDRFVVIYGDLLTSVNLKKMFDFHMKYKVMATVGLYRVNNPTECGVVKLEKDARITHFLEKPKKSEVFTNLANAGIYVVEPEIMKYIPKNRPYDFGKELFPQLLKKGIAMYGYPIKEYLIDIGTKDKYKKAKKDFIEGRVYPC